MVVNGSWLFLNVFFCVLDGFFGVLIVLLVLNCSFLGRFFVVFDGSWRVLVVLAGS